MINDCSKTQEAQTESKENRPSLCRIKNSGWDLRAGGHQVSVKQLSPQSEPSRWQQATACESDGFRAGSVPTEASEPPRADAVNKSPAFSRKWD